MRMMGTANGVFLAGDDTTTAPYGNGGTEGRGNHTGGRVREIVREGTARRKEKEKEVMDRPSPKSPI